MTTAADWLLEWLAERGVEVIFGNPGSTELPLIDALTRQRRVRYVLGLHEAAVMGMADGYAQQGDRVAVVNLHVQPGLANGLAGILNAQRARVPLIVTVGQQVTALKDRGPFLGGDVVAMAAPVAKAALELAADPGRHAAQMQSAWELALTHPRGPVVVSLPADVLAGPAAGAGGDGAGASAPTWGDATDDLERAIAILRDAERPTLLAGDGVVHERCGAALVALAELIGARIFGEPYAARFPVPAAHPLWCGNLPGFAAEIAPMIGDADAVLALGMPVFRLFGPSPQAAPIGGSLVHVDTDPAEIGRSILPAVGVAMPCADALTQILAGLGPTCERWRRRRAGVETEVAVMRRDGRERLAAACEDGADITPARLCAALARHVGDDDLVVDEALTAGRWLRTALGPRNRPDNWLAHRGSALGWGLPAAVGASLANPGRRVLCIHGDGSFLFGAQALWSAAHERRGLAVVVADNGGYEILRAGLEGQTGRADGPWPGIDLADPPLDVSAIARGYGASADRVDDLADLDGALGDLWTRATGRPAVLVASVTGRAAPVGYPIGP